LKKNAPTADVFSRIIRNACSWVDERRDPAHAGENSVAVAAGPINPLATGTTPETGRSRQDMRRRNLGHFLPRDIHEVAVALATARVLQGRVRPEFQAPEDLDQLILEIIATDEHRPRAGGRQLAVPGQQPPALGSGLLREHTILRSRLEKDAVEAEEPQPPRQ